MNAYQNIGSLWIVIAIVVIVVAIVMLVIFWIGYAIGSARMRQTKDILTLIQKDREQRRIIRMQAAPKPKRSSKYTGYYPGMQARRNQAKYRRALKKQTRMRKK